MTALVRQINRLLPQTQCRECGYEGCLPYARALAKNSAPVNLCAPGGETVTADIAGLLGKPPLAPAKILQPAQAVIDEAACIGCTACIRACPVDAIMGARKLMHTVIAAECTGCGLCVSPCPVDCIRMQPVETDHLPQARYLTGETSPRFAAAAHARIRYERREARKQRETQARQALITERETAAKARIRENPDAAVQPALNPADLIARAMAKAQTQQTRLITTNNRDDFKARQIEEARERAAYRRAQRDMKYGNETEKTAALEFLRRHKKAQEAETAALDSTKYGRIADKP